MRLTEYHLTESERALFEQLSMSAGFSAGATQGDIVAAAAVLAPSLDGDLREAIGSLHRPRDPDLLILRGLPDVEEPMRLLPLVGEALGSVVRYEGEGDYIIEIKEDPERAAARPSFANAREFFLHTDLSYVEAPPPYFAMHSVVNNTNEGGYSVFADVDSIVAELDPVTIEELTRVQFLFPAPTHYRGAQVVRFPILAADEDGRYTIRFRRDNLRAETRGGICAVIRLIQAMHTTAREVSLTGGSLALINNSRVLHGRTAFVSAANTRRGRHLNRMYINA